MRSSLYRLSTAGVLILFSLVGSCVGGVFVADRAAAEQPWKAAIFDFHFIDTSTEGFVNGPRADETERVERLNARLLEALEASGRYVGVDTAPVAEKVANRVNMAHCNGCDAALARELGADVAVTGEVQKVSNLILNINVYVRDAESGAMIVAGSADIRGNTDRSWTRGLDWLMRNRILKAD